MEVDVTIYFQNLISKSSLQRSGRTLFLELVESSAYRLYYFSTNTSSTAHFSDTIHQGLYPSAYNNIAYSTHTKLTLE